MYNSLKNLFFEDKNQNKIIQTHQIAFFEKLKESVSIRLRFQQNTTIKKRMKHLL